MKLPLATGFLSAGVIAIASRGSSGNGRFVLRVDRTFARDARPWFAIEEPSADDYREGAPSDRWEIAIEGSKIVLTEIGIEAGHGNRLEGREESAADGERRFHLSSGGLGDNGLFVVRGDDAELTLFATRAPVMTSERGKLLTL
jgi:hypothetical protein